MEKVYLHLWQAEQYILKKSTEATEEECKQFGLDDDGLFFADPSGKEYVPDKNGKKWWTKGLPYISPESAAQTGRGG